MKTEILTVIAGAALVSTGFAQINATAERIIAPTVIRPNTTVNLRAEIKNTGTRTILPGLEALIVLSADANVNKYDRVLARYTASAIVPKERHIRYEAVKIPLNIPTGTCYLGLVVDPDNKLVETTKADNVWSAPIKCEGLPDLYVTAVKLPAEVRRGGSYDVEMIVRNQGSAASSSCIAGLWISSSPTQNTWKLRLGVYTLPAIAPNTAVTKKLRVTIPTELDLGTCWVFGRADTDNRVPELFDNNNERRVFANCYHLGAFRTIGSACLGSNGLPEQRVFVFGGPTPVPGRTVRYSLNRGPKSSFAVLMLGASKTRWGTLPLPLRLDGAGAPGCSLLVSLDVLGGVPLSSTGYGKLELTIPNLQALVGRSFFTQFAGADAQANALGFSFTKGMETEIGNR